MCRFASKALPAEPESAQLARRFLSETCSRWALDELRDDLLLAVSELVTNSVVHTRTPIVLNAAVSSGIIEVGVRDHDVNPPVVKPLRADLLSDLDELTERLPSFQDSDPRHQSLWVGPSGSVTAGRGLHLLAAVSDDWGVATAAEGGKEVWFSNQVPATWPYLSDCACGPGATMRTASGRDLLPLSGSWD